MEDIRKSMVEVFGDKVEISITELDNGIISLENTPNHTDMYTDGQCHCYTNKNVFRNYNVVMFVSRNNKNIITKIDTFIKSSNGVIKQKAKNRLLEIISFAEYII